jgi:hypothetical protein
MYFCVIKKLLSLSTSYYLRDWATIIKSSKSNGYFMYQQLYY